MERLFSLQHNSHQLRSIVEKYSRLWTIELKSTVEFLVSAFVKIETVLVLLLYLIFTFQKTLALNSHCSDEKTHTAVSETVKQVQEALKLASTEY